MKNNINDKIIIELKEVEVNGLILIENFINVKE